MAAAAKRIEIGEDDRAQLERIVRAATSEARMVERARIVLEAGAGRSAAQIARRVGCSANTVQKWRARFEQQGLAGLRDPQAGQATGARPRGPGEVDREGVYASCPDRVGCAPFALDLPRACGGGRHLARRRTRFCVGRRSSRICSSRVLTDFSQPEFEERAGEICGLYLDPPANALVVSIDEKTGIQAKGLVRPDLHAQPGTPARNTHATAPRTCSRHCESTPAR